MTIGGSRNWKSQAKKMAAGFVVGAGGAILVLTLLGKERLNFDDPAMVLAVVAGLSYGIMGLFVGFGALAPRAGAHFLNVEDEEEIREERRNLGPSAAASILVGIFLLLLAFSSTVSAAIGTQGLALVAGALVAALVLITVAMKGTTDELIRQISLESSALTLHISLVVLAGWALLHQIGYVGWVSPLGLVAGLAMLELAVIFGIAAKKGLMAPR